jgi:hypothetical protein
MTRVLLPISRKYWLGAFALGAIDPPHHALAPSRNHGGVAVDPSSFGRESFGVVAALFTVS